MRLLPISNSDLKETLSREQWFVSVTQRRLDGQLSILIAAMNEYDAVRFRIIQRAALLAAEITTGMTITQAGRRREVMMQCQSCAEDLLRTLRSEADHFRRRTYLPLLPTADNLAIAGDELKAYADSVKTRFEDVVTPDAESCVATVTRMSERCDEGLNAKQKGA